MHACTRGGRPATLAAIGLGVAALAFLSSPLTLANAAASQRRASGRSHQTSHTRVIASRAAPVLTRSGYRLRWTRVAGASHYLLATLVRRAGQGRARVRAVRGRSFVPAGRWGQTVRYTVRAAGAHARWATTGIDQLAAPHGAASSSCVSLHRASGGGDGSDGLAFEFGDEVDWCDLGSDRRW